MADAESHEPLHLPPEIQADYERRMTHCRRIWDETNDPLILDEAATWARIYRQPPTGWLAEAVIQAKVRSPEQIQRYHADREHLARYMFIRDAVDKKRRANAVSKKMKWEQAWAAAAEEFDVGIEAVRKSYKKVLKDLRRQPSRFYRYWIAKPQNPDFKF